MSLRTRLLHEQLTSLEIGAFVIVAIVPLIFTPFADYSFATPKLLTLLVGVLFIAWSRPAFDTALARGGAIWILGLGLAALLGMDPLWSLMGSEHQNVGVITFGASVFLLAVAPAFDDRLRDRIPYWLFWTGVIVAAVSVITRFLLFGVANWRIDPLGSTIGHRVYVGGFLAASTLAATTIRRRPVHYFALVILASGLSVSAVRSAWIGTALGAILVVLLHRSRWKAVALTLLTTVVVSTLWVVATPLLPEHSLGYSAAQRFGQLDEGSAVERPAALTAFIRGWARDPWVGTGPSTGWYVFLRNANREELARAGRGFADAHNLVVEIGATSGLVGVIPLLVLVVIVFTKVLRAPPDNAWALGAAVALGIVHLLQPFNITLTPMLFLTAGLAVRRTDQREPVKRVPMLVPVLVVIATVLASARLLAASFEQFGRRYASESAFRWATTVEPRRMESVLRFANHRGFDARSGLEGAEEEARRLVERAIDDHGWNPRVRGIGANVMVLMNDFDEAERLIRRHLKVFPNDGEALAASAALALRRGDVDAAEAMASEALRIFPDSRMARTVLDDARSAGAQPDRG